MDRRPSRRRASPIKWAMALAGVSLAAGACGQATGDLSVPPAPSTAPSVQPASAVRPPATVCGSVPTLARLVLRRDDALPQNHIRFTLPSVVTVTDPTSVRHAAVAVCALPRMPPGRFSCPADFGVTYALGFSSAHQTWKAVTIDASGCQQVRDAGPTRWVARSPGFWRTFGAAIGVSNAGLGTFAGHAPNG